MPVRRLSPDKDTYVDAGSPDTNFGASNELFIRWQDPVVGGNDRETWLSVDLSPVFDDPDVEDIISATLRIPVQDSTGTASVDLSEADQGFTEDQLTWNNKPTGELEAFDGDVMDDVHEWDVGDEIDSMWTFEAGDRKDWYIVVDPHGSTALEASAEYDSREAGTGQQAELAIETAERRRDDLDSQLTVSKSGGVDLDGFVEVKFRGGRWESAEKTGFVDADGNAYELADIAWDTGRDVFWTVEHFAGAIVRRHERDGTHDVTFDVVEDGAKLATDLEGVAVVDGANVFIGTAGAAQNEGEGDVLECSVNEDNAELVVQQRNTAHEANPDWLTHDGQRVWILEFFGGKVEERDPSDWTLHRSGSIGSGDAYRGIARATDHEHLLLWKDTAGHLEEQHPDDLGTVVDSHDRDDIVSTGEGLAFRDRSWWGTLFIGEGGGTGSEVWALFPLQIESSLLVPTSGLSEIASTVQPSSIPGHADLDSKVSTGAEADLSSTVTPRVTGQADLDNSVQPANLDGFADLTTVAEVAAVPIDEPHLARTEGRVAPTVAVDGADMADVSGEVGSAITLDPDGEARDLRRVVHLLDGEERYPRARADPATRLHRGDAILYAQRGDELDVGDTLEWQQRRWRVAGLLGWEMVGDSRLYREVGLRRLATVHEARAIGTVS